MPAERYLYVQLHELLTYFGQLGVTTVMLMAQAGLVGQMGSPADVSYIADTVMLLRYFEAAGRVRKAISVIKKRTGAHEDTIRELTIDAAGSASARRSHGVPRRADRACPSCAGKRRHVTARDGRDRASCSSSRRAAATPSSPQSVLARARADRARRIERRELLADARRGRRRAPSSRARRSTPSRAVARRHGSRAQPPWSDFPLIVLAQRAAAARRSTSRGARQRDVLERPLAAATLLAAVQCRAARARPPVRGARRDPAARSVPRDARPRAAQPARRDRARAPSSRAPATAIASSSRAGSR